MRTHCNDGKRFTVYFVVKYSKLSIDLNPKNPSQFFLIFQSNLQFSQESRLNFLTKETI